MNKTLLAALPLAIILDIVIGILQRADVIPNLNPIVTGMGTFAVSFVLLLGVTQDL